jgi:hypothetical protein
MTTTYTYAFADGSQIDVTYDETATQTVNPPNGYAVTAISGTWQGSTIYGVNGDTGNYVNDASGLGYYDNAIFPNMGPTGDGANSLGNLDGIDTAGLLFQLTDGNGPLVQLYWDGSDLTSLAWTSVLVDSTPNGSGTATLNGFTACYAAGTRILTAAGEVPVEQLREGDSVVTMTSFGLSRIRWIGVRRVDVARHPRRFDVSPVRVRAHAFAEDRPHRDLLLSPDHAVFVDGVLIPVRYLVNGATVVQETIDSVTYYHVELGRHDVVLAEGLPAESYLDTGNRAAFANGGTTIQAHPDFARRVWQAHSCAPLITGGSVLDAAPLPGERPRIAPAGRWPAADDRPGGVPHRRGSAARHTLRAARVTARGAGLDAAGRHRSPQPRCGRAGHQAERGLAGRCRVRTRLAPVGAGAALDRRRCQPAHRRRRTDHHAAPSAVLLGFASRNRAPSRRRLIRAASAAAAHALWAVA